MLKQVLAVSFLFVSCKSTGNHQSRLQSDLSSDQGEISKRFDFTMKKNEIKDFGVDFFYSDYPYGQEVSTSGLPTKDHAPGKNFYQLTQHYGEQGKFKGQVIAYSNRSDDVDTNIQVKIGSDGNESLKPNTTYLISAKIDFVTDAPASAATGAGGSPNATYFGMVASQTPWSADIEANTVNDLLSVLTPEAIEEIGDEETANKMTKEDVRHLIEKFNLPVMVRTSTTDAEGKRISLRGPYGDCERSDAKTKWVCERFVKMGQVSNGTNKFEWRANSLKTSTPLTFKTDASGQPLFVNLVSHSGFEGVTVYYLTGVEIQVVEKK